MGTPIARRLLAGGNRGRVWNRSPERSEPLGAAGAMVAASPSAAVDGADVAVKLVANTGLVTAVAALHEALAVAAALGVDRQTALDVLGRGALGGAVGRVTAPGASFAVALAAKDARLALRRPVPAPVLEAALDLMRAAPDQDADLSCLVSVDFLKGC
ncbi:hypothetical protein CSH63_24490 [Micromonospora tulbaghiae]|uniref:6-phosphogluconate dehydrogenase NADP-binding domain-containing protein n=2 Tax=Micromonospora tulbaghiae TaxID=479978 RepID=A0A386WR77_9ACTN|nr:hypothetical protein CSH63_24490 [Micromonospora tulbaghiae]